MEILDKLAFKQCKTRSFIIMKIHFSVVYTMSVYILKKCIIPAHDQPLITPLIRSTYEYSTKSNIYLIVQIIINVIIVIVLMVTNYSNIFTFNHFSRGNDQNMIILSHSFFSMNVSQKLKYKYKLIEIIIL